MTPVQLSAAYAATGAKNEHGQPGACSITHAEAALAWLARFTGARQAEAVAEIERITDPAIVRALLIAALLEEGAP